LLCQIEPFSKLYLGCQYAILRKSFLKKNKTKASTKQQAHNVFINMGGTDQQNFTNKALQVCLKNKSIKKINIVVGSYYPYKKDLEKIATTNKHVSIKIHSNLSEEQIAALMKQSNAAICSASTIAYEYACLGGLLFVYQTVDNQKNIYSFLIKSKVAYPLQAFEKTLASFNTKAANTYFKKRSTYFSGNSTKNLQNIFENFILYLKI
jgi:spore coat polysaccharide biosynthesis predicted glycosyltransferase SpsG